MEGGKTDYRLVDFEPNSKLTGVEWDHVERLRSTEGYDQVPLKDVCAFVLNVTRKDGVAHGDPIARRLVIR